MNFAVRNVFSILCAKVELFHGAHPVALSLQG